MIIIISGNRVNSNVESMNINNTYNYTCITKCSDKYITKTLAFSDVCDIQKITLLGKRL